MTLKQIKLSAVASQAILLLTPFLALSWSAAVQVNENFDERLSRDNEQLDDGQLSTLVEEHMTSSVQECGAEISLVSNSLSFLVFPMSGLYDDNLNCQWTVQAPAGMTVELSVQRLSVQQSRDCGRDRLELFDISPLGVASSLSGRLCGYRNALHGSQQKTVSFTGIHQVALVRFLTDDSVSDTGFELSFRPVATVSDQHQNEAEQTSGHRSGQVTAVDRIVLYKGKDNVVHKDECPTIAILTAKVGVIKYPRDGGYYQNGARCQWLISTPPGNFIRMTVQSIDIESNRKCRFTNCCHARDSLTVFNGANRKSMIAAELCGTQPPSRPVYARSNQVLVLFTSNDDTVGRGFQLHYTQVQRGGPSAYLCSGDIIKLPHSDTGNLQPPGFNQSQRYPIEANCSWLIAVPSGKRILLSFDQFSLEDSDNCTLDSVRLFDGPDMTSRSLGRFCGQRLPDPVQTSGRYALVSLQTDASVSDGGFSISWTSISRAATSTNCAVDGCKGDTLQLIIDESGEKTLHSPNFGTGDNYPNNAWCSWHIIAPANTNVFLRFESIDLESPYSVSSTCYDAVTVFDGPDDQSDVIDSYCGQQAPPDILSSTNHILVTFQSDGSSQASGFLAHYSAKRGAGHIEGDNCGVPDVQPNIYNRIVGGDESAPHSWPWQVSLQYRQRGWQHWCGGSVLDRQWIITAAHCFYNFGTANDFRVVVGEHNRAVDEDTEQVMAVSHVIIHDQYNASNTDNDIALLKLSRKITFSRHIKPICLPHHDVEENTMCITTGWGDTRGTGNSSVLNQLHVPVLSRSVCNQPTWYSGRMTDNMMCAGYPEGRRDSCQGDSGGPLVCLDRGRWQLYGLTSWGENCASSHKPGIYTRTIRYLHWIEQKTGVTSY